MPSSFPGIDQIIADLLAQQKLERGAAGKPFNFPSQPSMSNVPAKYGQGVFNVAEGSGGAFARKALGKLARPDVQAAIAAGGVIGNQAGRAYNELLGQADESGAYLPPEHPYAKSLDRQRQSGVTTLPDIKSSPSQPSAIARYTPEQALAPLNIPIGSPQVNSDSIPPEMLAEAQDEIPPEMLVEAENEIPPEMLSEARLLEQAPPPKVSEMPESRSTLEALRQPRGQVPVRREPPKRNFFQHFGEFLRTGGVNRERFDYLADIDAYQRANALTERERLAGNIAASDIGDVRRLNQAAEMARYGGEGVSPQDKFLADYFAGNEKFDRLIGADIAKSEREHEMRKDLLQSGASVQKLDPEVVRAKFINDMLEKYPDISVELLRQRGIEPGQDFIESIRRGREKPDPADKFAAILDRATQIREALKSSANSGGNNTQNSDKNDKNDKSKRDKTNRVIKDTSMLQNEKTN